VISSTKRIVVLNELQVAALVSKFQDSAELIDFLHNQVQDLVAYCDQLKKQKRALERKQKRGGLSPNLVVGGS
jgi:hypothetical protein